MESLQNKVSIVTGASSGIGEGTAVLFARYGCKLTLTGRDEDRLNAVVKQCIDAGSSPEKIVTVLGDIRTKEVQEEVLNKTLKVFGKIDILVNNAGMAHPGLPSQTTEEQYDDMMDTNMKAIFFLSKLVAPELIKTKGNIVNVSSICSQRAMAEVAVYCMSKASLDMFTECLALELAPHRVRVNSVNPGTVVSRIYRRGPKGFTDEEYAKFLEMQSPKHPLGGVAMPEDVANTIAFLASDLSRFTSGTSVYVDGARHCVSVGVATSVSNNPPENK